MRLVVYNGNGLGKGYSGSQCGVAAALSGLVMFGAGYGFGKWLESRKKKKDK